jgi:hypothetical protein
MLMSRGQALPTHGDMSANNYRTARTQLAGDHYRLNRCFELLSCWAKKPGRLSTRTGRSSNMERSLAPYEAARYSRDLREDGEMEFRLASDLPPGGCVFKAQLVLGTKSGLFIES